MGLPRPLRLHDRANFARRLTPGLAAHGALRHVPLGAALRDYAGDGAKAGLLKLLEPISLASECCPGLKAVVDSGFQAPFWTEKSDSTKLF